MAILSIITICLNEAKAIRRTLESIECQIWQNFEWIIIDGGSLDGTLIIIEEFKSRIDLLISEPDNGIYDAMNKGIMKATGKYCLFLNAGDYLVSPDILQGCFEQINDEDIVYGDLLTNSITGALTERKYTSNCNVEYLLKFSLPHQATFIKRSLFSTHGLYNVNFSIVSDWLWFAKSAMFQNLTFRYISFAISVIDMSGVSNSRDYESILTERKMALKTILSDDMISFITNYYDMKEEYHKIKYNRYIKLLKFLHLIK